MKISKALLAKYAENNCTPEEKRLVENWLDTYETLDNVSNGGEFKAFHDDTWDEIARRSGFGDRKVITLAKTLFKYVAAACIVYGAFLGGRVTASPAMEKSNASRTFKEHLYVVGGNGVDGNLPGKRFKLKFDGTLRLFNASQKEQIVVTGDSTFVLVPGKTYYLIGSTDSPKLINNLIESTGHYSKTPKVSEFSILRIDKK
ncbi:MAG: hypothetical protein AAF717_04155 [Bacteroidota bacterium]